jgi:glutamate dehydrogenase (NADP+)
MPTMPNAIRYFQEHNIPFAPGKAANAGGVAVSGLEMTQNAQHLQWTAHDVEERLFSIMESIHNNCITTAAEYDAPGNYVAGANIAGFLKVAQAMVDQGPV